MAGQFTQEKGSFKAGTASASTEYGAAITSVKIGPSAGQVEIPATLATGETDAENGPLTRSVEFTYLAGLATSSFSELLRSAVESFDGELFFDIKLSGDAVGVNNPRHTGVMLVPSAMVGAAVGALRQETLTCRIKPGTYSRLTA